MKGLGKGG